MTNEQEAIEYLKESVLIYKNTIPKMSNTIDTVLSLIKAQQEEISKYKTLYERALSDVVKTDKQIDLMANSILAREIGKNSCQFNETCIKFEKGRDTHCKDCIKQYFERKVNSSEQN